MLDNLGVKIVCLLVALLLWVQVASTVDIEEMVLLPLSVVGLPDSLAVPTSRLPEHVAVRIRGSRLQLLLANVIQQELGRVEIDLSTVGPGRHRFDLSVLDVRVSATPLEIVPPVTLDILVDDKIERVLSVRLLTEGEVPEGFALAGRPELTPETVTLEGPRQQVEAVEEILTETVRLSRRRESFRQMVKLVSPDPDVKMRPIEVELALGIDAVVERVFDEVLVTVFTELDSEWIELHPVSVRVHVTGAAGIVNRLSPEEISVRVPIDPNTRGVAQIPAEVVVPDGVVAASVEPSSVQVIVDVPDSTRVEGAGGR